MHYDVNGDGTPENRGAPYSGSNTPWATGFPNAMTAAGCPPRDHDADPATPEQASCIGYELLNDLTITTGNIGVYGEFTGNVDPFTAKFVGNGFRVHGLNLTQHSNEHNNLGAFGQIGYSGSIEGLGLIRPDVNGGYSSPKGTISAWLRGKVIGSYVEGGWTRYANTGGLVGEVATHTTDGYGLIAHSYVRGTRVGLQSLNHGGLAATFQQTRGTNRATCLNSYFSGDVDSPDGTRSLLVATNQSGQGRFINCVGDSTTDANDGNQSTTATVGSSTTVAGTTAATNANMIAVTGYNSPSNNPFSGWDDYPLDGSITALGAGEPRTDAWHFGDETNLPVLKAWGHDYTLPLDRSVTGASTVNICTRTLAVANEIIKHLKDNVRRAGVTSTPAAVSSLTPCSSNSDTKNVSITNLTDQVVTNPTHTFDISGDDISALDWDDFAYLTNAKHFDLSDNELTTLPIRLFQGIPLRYLDLSYNSITSLHPGTFDGVADVTDVGGNTLLLHNNTLTDTGIPGRLFDTLDHLNGLDLSDNALTRINTRWFEQLNDLGRKAAASPPYTHALGLHLGGNAITEHYYSNKLFTGVRESIVSYVDVTTPTPTSAGDILRDKIIAASSDTTNLSLSGTDFWFNAGGTTTGYQASSVTQCLATQTAAAGRGEYFSGTTPDCQIQHHWTPPDMDTGPTSAPSTATLAIREGDRANLRFSHTASATWAGYQMRHRVQDGEWSNWLMAPITAATGDADTPSISARAGNVYQFEIRAFSTTGPTEIWIVTLPVRDWIPSFAATHNPGVGTITLAWGLVPAISLPANHSVTAYYYRYKLSTATSYGNYMQVPDGPDGDSAVNNETSYTITGLTTGAHFDVQFVAAIDDEDADSVFDYYTDPKASYGFPPPTGFTAAAQHQRPGYLTVNWDQQTAETGSTARFEIRHQYTTDGTWSSWAAVPDSAGDADTDRHNETSHTFTGLKPGRPYDIELRFHDGTIASSAARLTVPAGNQPLGLRASAGVLPGRIDVSWDALTYSETGWPGANQRFRIYAKKSSETDWGSPDLVGNQDANPWDETGYFFLLERGVEYDIRVEFMAGPGQNDWPVDDADAVAYIPQLSNVRSRDTDPPGNFTAVTAPATVNAIDLAWDQQTFATDTQSRFEYRIKLESAAWPTSSPFGWTAVPDSGDPGNNRYDETRHSLTGLTAGAEYDVEMRFYWHSSQPISTAVSASAIASAVPAPLNFTAVPSTFAARVNLAWDAVSGATEYRLRRKTTTGGTWSGWVTGLMSTSASITGLTGGTSYDFEVRAVAGTVESPSATATATAQTIPPPTSVTFAQGTNAGEIDVGWSPPATGSPTGYEVRYKLESETNYPGSGPGAWADVPDGDGDGDRADERSHTVTGLRGGASYDLQLRAETATDFSIPRADTSGTVIATPMPAPTGLVAATGAALGTIDIAWTPPTLPPGHSFANYQYSIKFNADADTAYSAWTDMPAASTSSYAIPGRVSGILYDVRIRAAVDDADADSAADYFSLISAAATGRAPVNPPAGLTATAGTNPGDVNLTWNVQTTFGATFTTAKYQFRSKIRTAAWPTTGDLGWTDISGTGVLSASAAVVAANGQENDVQLRFVPNSAITSAAASARVTTSAVTVPTGLSATTDGTQPSAIALTWNAQSATTGSEAKYQVRRKLASTAAWPNTAPFGWTDVADSGTDGAHNESGVALTGLDSGQSYNVQLRFHWSDAAGASAATATATATASTVPAPTGLTTTVDYNAVALTWTQQTTGTSTEAHYEYRAKKTTDNWPATSPFGWTDVPSSGASTTTYTVTGLEGGNLYDLEVRFHWDNAAGPSAGTATTATPTAIPAPTGVTATPSVTPRQMTISWTAQSTITDSDAKWQTRLTPKSPTGTPGAWTDVADSDSDNNLWDESTTTRTGLTPNRPYDVEVRLLVGTAEGYATKLDDIRAGYQPRNFTAAAGDTPGTIVMKWDQQTVYTGSNARFATRIKKSSDSSWSGWNYVGTANTPSGHGATGHTYTGLDKGVDYDVIVSFRDSIGWATANTIAYTPRLENVEAAIVLPPENLNAVTSPDAASAVTLTWDEQTESSVAASHFEYRYKTTATAAWTTETWRDVTDGGDANTHSYDETGVIVYNLTTGTSYDFQVRFHWNPTHGESTSVSATATASAIPAPASFTASAGAAPGSVNLGWDLVNGINDLQYRYKIKTAPSYPTTGAGSWMSIPDSNDQGSSAGDETAFTVTGLTAGTEYTFQIQARVQTTAGPSSTAEATAQTQSAPQTFTVAAGTAVGSLTVTFTAPAGGTPTRYDYRYKRATETNYPATWTQVPDVNSNNNRVDDLSFTITSLWAGVSYNVQLTVTSQAGTSQPSTVTQTATALPAPASFTATIGTDPGEIDLSWTQITTGLPSGDSVVNYQFRRKQSFGAGQAVLYTSWTNIPGATTSSHTITLPNSYVLYDIQLRAAVDDGGDADSVADYHSNVASDTQTRSGLAIPANLRATAGTNPGELDLAWNAQTAFGATFTTAVYQVRSKLTTASWPTTGDLGWANISGSGRTSTSHTLTALMAAQQYDVQLRFLPNSSLTSGAASVQGTPTAVPTPSGFGATTSGNEAGAIELTWTAQTASTDTNAKYQYRSKTTTAAWPATTPFGWNDVPDSTGTGGDADTDAHNESAFRVTGLSAGQSHNIELRFHWSDAVGPSAAVSRTANASTIPTPGSFSASTGSGPGEIDLSWSAVVNATYQVRTKLSTAADSTYSAWSMSITGTTHTVTGLTNAQTYTIQLRANVTGVTGSSPVTTATAQAQSQPGPQMYTTAQGTNAGEISMSWQAPSGGTVVEYEYRYKLATDAAYPADGTTGGWNGVPDGSDAGTLVSDETGFVITSLLGGLSYNVQLRVETQAGHSLPATSTRTATPVAAPGSFTAARGTAPGTIDLTWAAATGMPTGDSVVQYQFRTKLSSAGASTYTAWTNIAGATTTSYTVTGLPAYTLHDIQLRAAIDDGGDADSVADYHSSASQQSGIRTGLAVPADLRATGGTNPGEVALTWTAQTTFSASSFGSAEYEFRTKLTTASWPTTGDLGWTDIGGSSATSASHTITGLMNGQLHDIQLRFLATSALFSAGASVQATPTPIAVPSGLQATTAATTSGAIDLEWTPQSAITVSTAQFQYRTKLTSAAWTGVSWNPIPDSTGTGGDADTDAHNEDEYTITGLTADAQYDVQLRLFMSTAVGASAPATSRATASRVPVPTGFNATTGSGAGEIDLSWTAVMGATDYQYRCSPAASGCPNTWSTAITGTTYTITNLTGGAFYNVQLRARVTGIGESAPTSSQRAQAQTTPGPASLTFSHGPAPGDIKLDWTAPANNAPVEHYEYRYKLETASDSAYSAWSEVMDSTDAGTSQADETTITISSLQAGASYHVQFRVYASDAIQYSLPQRGTQTARPVPPPTSFAAAMGANPGEVTLSWTVPSGVTILRYELRHRLGTTGNWSSWTSAGTSTSYTYTGLLAGASRTFNLRAVMQTVGASAPVSVAGTPTPVPTPTGFMASTGTFPGEIDLTWGAVTGATSYQYRYGLTATPPATVAWSDWTTPDPALSLAVTLTQLAEGASYDAEVRALITNVGMSTAASRSATSRGPTFADPSGTPAPPTDPESGDSLYEISATILPGRITIKIPAGGDPFIYRHRTTNPGEWSPWMKVTPTATQTQFHPPIRDFTPGIRYDIQVRVYTVATSTFTTALMQNNLLVLALKPAENFGASETSGVILLEWDSPMQYQPDSYQYRTRPTGTAEWGDWVTVQHAGAVGSKQRHYVTGLEPGISHDFQLIMRTGEVATDPTESSATARLRIAEVHSIAPVVREVSIRAGETIALTVDIYDTQEVLDNTIPDATGSKLIFRWTEQDSRGRPSASGGTFGTPNDERRVSYTAPSSPGVYTIQAEAQPDGVCTSHHRGAPAITTAEREPCQAIFTIRVTAAPTVAPPRPDPVNPTGSIPTSLTDNQGVSYAVVTPADGGTFTGQDITITAPEGAVPDRTILGITARVSDITPPAPIPGATISVSGAYYEINALQESGDPPLQSYTLAAPVTACLPFPDEFRATLSNVVLIQRTPDGNLSPLSTKIRTANGQLSVCGTISTLPATVAVARLGLVPAATDPTPAPEQPLPDTGAPAPSPTTLLLTLTIAIGILSLTATSKISRITRR